MPLVELSGWPQVEDQAERMQVGLQIVQLLRT
jgi:hypothetical protein